jgi:hypothetical protein
MVRRDRAQKMSEEASDGARRKNKNHMITSED